MQQQQGNGAVQRFLAQTAVIQRCGDIPCDCTDEERQQHTLTHPAPDNDNETNLPVQRAADDFQVRGRFTPRPGDDSFKNFVFFDLADAGLDTSEQTKIDTFIATLDSPAQPIELVGFASEEGDTGVNTQLVNDRIAAVAQKLIAAGHDPDAIKRSPRSAASTGRIEYRSWRAVEMLKDKASTSRPDCSTQPQTTPFGFMQRIGFNLAKLVSLGMIQNTADELRKVPTPAGIQTLAQQIFGPAVSLNDIADGLDKVHSGLSGKTPDNTNLGTACHQTCQGGMLAFVSGGTDEMTLCPAFFESDGNKRAHILIHESCHLTPGLSVTDRAYGWERLVNVLGTLAPAHALDNADSYALLVLFNNGLSGISGTEAPVDDLSALPSGARGKIAEALAYMQRWLTRSRSVLNWFYGLINQGIKDNSWDPNALDGMRFIASQFGLGIDSSKPRDRDRAVIAGIFDRIMAMGRGVREALVITQATDNTEWEPGPGKKVAVAPSLAIRGVLARVRLLLRRLATATPSIRRGLETAYVNMADKLRRDRGEGP
jgi:outer membrane protein OmpA-like peptidoglycan-associated protein